ncbi:MAG: hydrogenase formation protein HypD [Deltaproteobacteria bacterium]|nr:hydrogenase formation protein HypD [Deltaproteobacteria bacterium]
MKYLDEFREKEPFQAILSKITSLPLREISLMEVCGTHTVSISKSGIRSLLPKGVRLISGPGCPVCVTSLEDVERIILLAEEGRSHGKYIIATFGDMMRVPGSHSSLFREKAKGSDIRIVYSPADALTLERKNPDKEVIFFAVGFETTSPTTAATLLQAKRDGIHNFSIISNNKLIPPAMEVLLSDEQILIDGFLCPGHVSAIIGTTPYQKVVNRYHKGCVISGFEPLDIILSIYFLMLQKRDGIPKGLNLKDEFSPYDATKKFDLPTPEVSEPKGCRCDQVLKGMISPKECPLFATQCNPSVPVGACMVSSEGTCATYYKYER